MSLRSLPLRFKLVIALVLPMLLVTVLIGDRVGDSIESRGVAGSQEDEAARLEAVAEFSDAVGSESVTTSDPTATTAQLAAARSESDAALERLSDPSLGLDSDVVRRAGAHHAALVEIREFVGERPADIGLRFQLEAYIDRQADEANPASMVETVPSALARLYGLPTAIAAEFEFDPDAVVDVETARLLADYQLVQRLRADHVREVSALLQLGATPATLVDEGLISDVRERMTETDLSRGLIYEYAAAELVSEISVDRRSIAGAEYAQLRGAAGRATPGVASLGDIAAVNRSGAVVTSQYTALSDGVVSSIRQQATTTSNAATTSLILVLVAGAWMLVIAGLILRTLYRSIRSPLDRLTKESQHIANVELPYVVAAMRDGELDEVPTTTDLVADANDEIGELVHAFNDMHRTAVELAAEQAGSRRIVADMFVNLGRRNQRLVNRLLKRLTSLERDERDPDKLAGLYEIDHVVTRMRRNAESLLVLAGASQSRKWDRPVEAYDIARAALSEVEGYERVEIIADDDFEIHGDVVADLTHLLAELVENALSFSPPSAGVELAIRRVGDDHLISISDGGVGMTEPLLAEANNRIRRAGDEAETPSEFLGHYVIGRLAARHAIDVHLSTGLGAQGIVADVFVPVGAVVPATQELVDGFEAMSSETAQVPEAADAAPEMPVAPSPAPAPVATAPVPAQAAHVPAPSPAADATERPEWGSVVQEVRRPAVSAPLPLPPLAPTPAPISVPAPAAATLPREASLAELAEPPAGSSFDYPPLDQIDPRQREYAPTPPRTPAPEPVVPGGLDAARNEANNAVQSALSVFGASRRTPGASLPNTSLVASMAGSMSLDAEPAPATPPASAPVVAPTHDPDEIRFQLSGFQSGTRRADRED